MIGGTKKSGSAGDGTQTFIMSLNSKANPPIFKTTYWDDDNIAHIESSYLSDVKIRGVLIYEDEYQGKKIPKFEIQLYATNQPYINVNAEQDKEKSVRHLYKIRGSFSLKGRELLNNVAGAIMDQRDGISISIKKAFKKNESTGKYDVPVMNKEGEQVYNMLVFVKEGDKVSKQLPLFADADFCEHPLKDEYVKAEKSCAELETGKPLAKFWQDFITSDLQKAAFEIYESDMGEKGITVTVENWEKYTLKHVLPEGQSSNDSEQDEDEEEFETTAEGVDDGLPF